MTFRSPRPTEIMEQMAEIRRQLDSVYTALVIRDPGTPLSAETYEGLRRQVVAGAQERLAHLVQLTEFDIALDAGADVDTLKRLVNSWMSQAGLDIERDPSSNARFEPIEGEGPFEVAIPAYVDATTGRTIRQGRLQPSANEPPKAEPSPEDGSVPSTPMTGESTETTSIEGDSTPEEAS